jgi:hypothetical protein
VPKGRTIINPNNPARGVTIIEKTIGIFSVAGGDTCHGGKTPSRLNAGGMKYLLNAIGMKYL